MIDRVLAKVFGTQHERDIKKLLPRAERINPLEPSVHALSDEELRAKTSELKARLAEKLDRVPEEEMKEARARALDDLLEEAFAVAREASVRALGMRPFDVQLIGGMVLHQGKISEMKTGEGKTLVATMPVYLNALTGRGVHVITVNDYLARRDAEWMGKIYRFLGLTVGCIQNSMLDDERQKAYAADVTYGTNNECGFDYLRDNMKFELESMVQRGHVYAIVDEVDSILIDEARTPLIRRSAPGGRGQRERAERAREQDARVDHAAELLQPLREARRHDRHRRHRGIRVPPDLQAGCRRHPDQRADDPGRPPGRRLRL